MPKREGGRGDVIVHVQLRMPEGHNHEAIERALTELDAHYLADPRAHLKP